MAPRTLSMRRSAGLGATGVVYLILAAIVIVGALLTASVGRNFFSPGNITAILTGTSILGFIAIGQTLVILGGSLDLSVPFVTSLTGVVAAQIMAGESGNVGPGVLVALALGAGIGLVNGLIVTQLRVHGFIATLGMGLILSGYLASNYRGNTGSAPREFRLIGATHVGPVPVSTLIMLACAALAILLLRRTRVGLHLYAVGGNDAVARLSGVKTAGPIIMAHVACSLLAAMAGLLLLARLGTGNPTIGSQGGYDLMSIAAVVLGGTILAGGRGSIAGTLGGIGIFAVMDNVMGALQVNPFIEDAIRGLVIVAAVAVYARRNISRRPARFDTREHSEHQQRSGRAQEARG